MIKTIRAQYDEYIKQIKELDNERKEIEEDKARKEGELQLISIENKENNNDKKILLMEIDALNNKSTKLKQLKISLNPKLRTCLKPLIPPQSFEPGYAGEASNSCQPSSSDDENTSLLKALNITIEKEINHIKDKKRELTLKRQKLLNSYIKHDDTDTRNTLTKTNEIDQEIISLNEKLEQKEQEIKNNYCKHHNQLKYKNSNESESFDSNQSLFDNENTSLLNTQTINSINNSCQPNEENKCYQKSNCTIL